MSYYMPVNPAVEYIVHDENDVVVAVCAHERDARKLCGPLSTYGYFSDTSRYCGTNRVGQDVNHRMDRKDRLECKLPPKNAHAVR